KRAMKAKKSFRPPPRLRTKTGCSTCRTRRKKCDEAKPICFACQRLNIPCNWRDAALGDSRAPASPTSSSVVPSDAASDMESVVDISMPASLEASIWSLPQALRTQQDFNIFEYCARRYMNILVFPEAGTGFRDMSFLFNISYQYPFVMHAALAPAALHASFAALIPREDAMVYTQSALQGLRQATGTLAYSSDARDAFLTASLFMGIFEDFYPAASSASLTHYRAIGKVLEQTIAGVPRLQLSSMSFFERTLLDSVLYHFATRLLLAEDIEPTCASFPTATVAKYIEALDSERDDYAASASVLPVIGKIPPALFLAIYQVTWLSRQLPFVDDQNQNLALQCLSELDSLQDAHPILLHENDADFHHLSNSDIAAKLYALALRIFLAKVIDPDNVSSTSSWIEALLATGLALLKRYDGSALFGQFITWPMLVLGCASCPVTLFEMIQDKDGESGSAVRAQTRHLIQALLLQIWEVSFSGYVKRTATALENIWKIPNVLRSNNREYGSDSDEETLYDGLIALISKKGPGPGL
ncbi:uncharacterized protein A1O9_00777, partial [Exophiala aquamarina CBS 119918]